MAIVSVRQCPSPLRPWAILAAPAIGLAVLACCFGGARPDQPPPRASTWRRTRDGWQQTTWPAGSEGPCGVPFHPLCAATLQGLLAAMALVGHASPRRKAYPKPAPHFLRRKTDAPEASATMRLVPRPVEESCDC
ncbi:MAG TPA: hypothetical protein VNH11_01175 [Pirellulales bacterium]|nr:hypothetical protein [Pirellulales bacterium]